MWQTVFFLSVPLIMFLLCLLQDQEIDEDIKFLIQYRHIQDEYRK